MDPLVFAALGHLTNDRLDTGLVPGGSALYAALAAAELGAKARIVTSVGADFVGEPRLSELGVHVDILPAAATTTFENRYVGGRRTQRVLAVADSLCQPVPSADVVFACPVIGEVEPSALLARDPVILAAGLQGWLRELRGHGVVVRRALDDTSFLASCDVLFMSDEDLGADSARIVPSLCELARIVVVTEGARGARVYISGVPHRVYAHPAREVDPTGAGDVFATAFLISLAKGEGPLEAAVAGACAASLCVEDVGPAALARLGELEQRVAWYAAQVRAPHVERAVERPAARSRTRAVESSV